MTPEISVLLTSYGPAPFLREALRSVVDQREKEGSVEVLVLSDRPRSREELFGPGTSDPRNVRLVEAPEPQKGKFFAAGIEACAGDLIALLNDDDVWKPGRLDSARAAMLGHPEIGLHKTGVEFFGEGVAGPVGRHRLVGPLVQDAGVHRRGPKGWPSHLGRLGLDFNDSSLTLRRSVLLQGIGHLRKIDASEDTFYLFVTLACSQGLAIDPQPLVRYRVHAQNTSGAGSQPGKESLARTHREWVRRAGTYRVISEMVQELAPGRSDVAALAERGVRLSGLMSALTETPTPRRTVAARTFDLLAVAGRYAAPLDFGVVGLGAVSVVAPSVAQRALLRWGN